MSPSTSTPVALVTGGTSRIGAVCANTLAHSGHDVIAHWGTTAPTNTNPSITHVQADLAHGGDALIDHMAAYSNWSVLINNASAFAPDTLDTLTEASYTHHHRVNTLVPHQLVAALAARNTPALVVHLLDVMSVWDTPPPTGKQFYSHQTAKLVLERAVAWQHHHYPHLRVVGLALGFVLPTARQTLDKAVRMHLYAPLCLGGSMHAIADAIKFILHCPSLSGQVLRLDGGMHLRG